MFQHSH